MSPPSDVLRVFAEWASALIEGVGIALIAILSAYALVSAAIQLVQGRAAPEVYRVARERLVHGILFGLEFLVAADIIHTVAVELTFRTVGVLAIIVAIRTFLSFTLEVEISGRWPWQQSPEPAEHGEATSRA